MSKDDLGDRMKAYERRETDHRLFQTLPIYARIDGKGFSKFTKGMDRPFDQRLTDAMIAVAKHLMRETGARFAYTQSDEISLVWKAEDHTSNVMFEGKVQKLTSVLASMAAAKMAQAIRGWAPFEDRLPAFDARVLQLPHDHEAANMILWRALDAQRNAVSMACRSVASHKEMQRKTRDQMLDLIAERGVDFDAYPASFRQGTYLRWGAMPRAGNPSVMSRAVMVVDDMPPLHRVANRTEFVMGGALPILKTRNVYLDGEAA
ncbi:tRNA-His guanylyltransferase [Brevundimonas phage vB_BpoS-Kikimora]|uniref:tRNA-His guanylyltransferase n=1 Tax=Brevundimonas phage vB_BpoS-Kikimora TaxID=2948601 RepID=A0A9E7SKR0_9CAUD|nr:tRNA-His guanylyltransferase [Brevundimonas phage vB_BpoS-Kikimora]